MKLTRIYLSQKISTNKQKTYQQITHIKKTKREKKNNNQKPKHIKLGDSLQVKKKKRRKDSYVNHN